VQLGVVLLSGSVALLSDTIHSFGDAATAEPLLIAFALTRLGTSRRFPYGYGRVEDLAGVVVVLIILFSALVAGYQAVERIINPQPVGLLWTVALAGMVGFVGNEAVTVFRIRVGRQIGSTALVADGYLVAAVVHVDPSQESGEVHHSFVSHSHDGLPTLTRRGSKLPEILALPGLDTFR
jgi:cation diffusion facilitator family transporter